MKSAQRRSNGDGNTGADDEPPSEGAAEDPSWFRLLILPSLPLGFSSPPPGVLSRRPPSPPLGPDAKGQRCGLPRSAGAVLSLAVPLLGNQVEGIPPKGPPPKLRAVQLQVASHSVCLCVCVCVSALSSASHPRH